MRIEKEFDYFVIARGRARESYFCFMVDHDASCWTSKNLGRLIDSRAKMKLKIFWKNYISELVLELKLRR